MLKTDRVRSESDVETSGLDRGVFQVFFLIQECEGERSLEIIEGPYRFQIVKTWIVS